MEVSVDTRTKGKNLAPYQIHRIDDVKILVAPRFGQYATEAWLDTGRGLARRRLKLWVDHRHGPACRHDVGDA